MNFTLDMLKKVKVKRDCWCLWCREVIPACSEHYKRRKKYGLVRRYHIDCVDGAIGRGQFDGLMYKEG